jgi:hypothetical protein
MLIKYLLSLSLSLSLSLLTPPSLYVEERRGHEIREE